MPTPKRSPGLAGWSTPTRRPTSCGFTPTAAPTTTSSTRASTGWTTCSPTRTRSPPPAGPPRKPRTCSPCSTPPSSASRPTASPRSCQSLPGTAGTRHNTSCSGYPSATVRAEPDTTANPQPDSTRVRHDLGLSRIPGGRHPTDPTNPTNAPPNRHPIGPRRHPTGQLNGHLAGTASDRRPVWWTGYGQGFLLRNPM